MKTQLLILLVGLPALLFVSCTIEKRVHLPGYHIERTSQHAWKKQQRPESGGQLSEQLPAASEQPLVLQPEPVLAASDPAKALVAESVSVLGTAVPVENALQPAAPTRSPELKTQRFTVPFKVQFPGSEKTFRQTDDRSSVSQLDSRNRAGLLLAPLKILFTILLIVLVVIGVIMLFVLETALGGTVLLAAGAVLLILILL